MQSLQKFPREFAPDTFWLTSCLNISVQGKFLHNHNSCFLIKGDEKTVLIDTAVPFGWQQIKAELRATLGKRTLNYIFVTHPEAPHMGNAEQLLAEYPQAKLIGDLRNYELYFPDYQDRFITKTAGDQIELGNRDLIFVSAAVHDLQNTLWCFDTKESILFVSDGYPYTHDHQSQECAMTSEEFLVPPDLNSTLVVIQGALGWTRHVPPEITIAKLDAVLQKYSPKFIAPAHGGVITNPSEITQIFKAGLKKVYKEHS
ncbi:MAG: MBL fold metallo-hydrolase [Myxococcaceae bacterium]